MISMRSSYMKSRVLHDVHRASRDTLHAVRQTSSGRRVRSAADNAAEINQITKFRARNRSRKQAKRNCDQMNSLLKIGEGGLRVIQDQVNHLKELAVQAANDSLKDTERAYIQTMVTEVVASIRNTAFKSKHGEHLPQLHKVPVDIGFVVDASGSMGTAHAVLKEQINLFKQDLLDAGFHVSFGLATTGHGGAKGDNLDNTRRQVDIGALDFDAKLESTLGTGGGSQDPYAGLLNSGVHDYPGEVDPDLFSWRTGSHRMLVLMNDTDREVSEIMDDPFVPSGIDGEDETADLLAEAGIMVHVLTNPQTVYDDITTKTEGFLGSISDVAAGLDNIADLVDEAIEAPSIPTVQVGVDNTAADQLQLEIPVDATELGLAIDALRVGTLQDAQDAVANIDDANAVMAVHWVKFGSAERTLNRISDHLGRLIVDGEQSRSNLEDADLSQTATAHEGGKVRTEMGLNALRTLHDINSKSVMSLISGASLGLA